MSRQLCVVYRTGGTENFAWHRSAPTRDRDEAQRMLRSVVQGGRVAHLADYDRSLAIGLPETFDAADPVVVEFIPKGE